MVLWVREAAIHINGALPGASTQGHCPPRLCDLGLRLHPPHPERSGHLHSFQDERLCRAHAGQARSRGRLRRQSWAAQRPSSSRTPALGGPPGLRQCQARRGAGLALPRPLRRPLCGEETTGWNPAPDTHLSHGPAPAVVLGSTVTASCHPHGLGTASFWPPGCSTAEGERRGACGFPKPSAPHVLGDDGTSEGTLCGPEGGQGDVGVHPRGRPTRLASLPFKD